MQQDSKPTVQPPPHHPLAHQILSQPDKSLYYMPMKVPTKLSTTLESFDYNMNHKNRGFCIIFDMENFHPSKKLPRRQGSHVDSTGLYNLFRALSFEVITFKDCTAKKVLNQLDYFANLDHSDNDCFACCFLTHGEYGKLWASDCKFPIDRIFRPFLGNNCPSLVGKPKLFFVQACQGEKLDDGVPVIAESLDSVAVYSIPIHADFLVAYSTIPGFYSWRNTQDGSWFMQALIRVLGEFHEELDLLTMLTIVSHRVAFYKASNATSPDFNDKKQIPCLTTMLTRRVFLRPKGIGS